MTASYVTDRQAAIVIRLNADKPLKINTALSCRRLKGAKAENRIGV
jgi:hypothetical protein